MLEWPFYLLFVVPESRFSIPAIGIPDFSPKLAKTPSFPQRLSKVIISLGPPKCSSKVQFFQVTFGDGYS